MRQITNFKLYSRDVVEIPEDQYEPSLKNIFLRVSQRIKSTITLQQEKALSQDSLHSGEKTVSPPHKYWVGDTVTYMPTGKPGIVTQVEYKSLYYAGEAISPRWMYQINGIDDPNAWISEDTLDAHCPKCNTLGWNRQTFCDRCELQLPTASPK